MIYIRSICSLVLLKIFSNIQNSSRKKSTVRSSLSQVFYKIGVLKKFAKFTRKHKTKQLRTTASARWSFSCKNLHIVGVWKKFFEWLVA